MELRASRPVLAIAIWLIALCPILEPFSGHAEDIRWSSQPLNELFPASKTVLVYLYSDTCEPCAQVNGELLPDPPVAAFINANFLPVKLDISVAEGRAFSKAYQAMYTPTFLFLGPDRKELDRLSGYQGREQFLAVLKQIASGKETLGSYQAKLQKNPSDATTLLKVFQKYTDRSDLDNMLKYKALIEQADEITYIINKENILSSLQRVFFAQRRYEEALQTTLAIIEQLPDADPRIQYSFLASCYRYLQEEEKALAAHEKLIAFFPDDLTVYKNAVQFIAASSIDLDKALAIGLRGMTRKGASTDKAELAFTLSQIYHRTVQYLKALEMVDTAIVLFPFTPYIEFREDILDSMNGVSFRNLTAAEVKAVIDDAKVNKRLLVILDVRTPEEFNSGHLPNARNIPVDSIEKSMSEFSSSSKDYVVVYCTAGMRSKKAARILARGGFSKVLNMTEGFSAWKAAGFQVEGL